MSQAKALYDLQTVDTDLDKTAQSIGLIEAQLKESGELEKAGANWRCQACSYVYVPAFGDPCAGVPAGIAFERLPNGWACPECGVSKAQFEKIEPWQSSSAEG